MMLILRLLSIVCLTGCGPSVDETRLKEENTRLFDENRELRRQAEEKARYAKVVEDNPDKYAFDNLEQEYRASSNVSELIPKYRQFQDKFRESPLAANAAKRIREIEQRMENQRLRQKREDEFQGTTAISLDDLCSFPEKHLGRTYRVEGRVQFSAYRPAYMKTFHVFSISNGSSSIFAAADRQIYESLMLKLQGKKTGTFGEFRISVSRDSDLNMLYEITGTKVTGW